MDAAWGSQVLGMELRYLLWGVVEIFPVFPGISFYPIAFPLNQVLEFPLKHPTVQDLFHNILLFPIYKFWRRWRVLTIGSLGAGDNFTTLKTG